MKPYDAEFRGEVLAACDTNEERARLRCVSMFRNLGCGASNSNVARQARSRQRQAAPRQPKWHAWADWLIAKIAARPDIYLRELQAELKRERGEDVCLGTICAACRALEQSRKKRR